MEIKLHQYQVGLASGGALQVKSEKDYRDIRAFLNADDDRYGVLSVQDENGNLIHLNKKNITYIKTFKPYESWLKEY